MSRVSLASIGSNGGRTGRDTSPTYLDEAAIGGPAGQLVPARQLELAQNGRHVALDRLGRDAQVASDFLVCVSPCDEAQDLALARRELVEVRVRRRGRHVGEGV